MAELKSKEIDGFTYQCAPMAAWPALDASHALARLLGPTGAAALALKGENAQATDLAGALATVLLHNTAADVKSLSKQLLSGMLVSNGRGGMEQLLPLVDVHFQGRILSMMRVLIFSIQVNFPDFFAALSKLGGKLGARLKAMADDSPSISPATGLAGDSSKPVGPS